MNKTIDLNCDMGESFGTWSKGNDGAIMPLITSANIACGFHAGDPATIAETIQLALKNDVAIGAHPSYPDLQGFGRREMALTPRDVYSIVAYQVSAVKGLCEMHGTKLHHVKPHGALYNKAARDAGTSAAIAQAVFEIDPGLVLYGLAGSNLISEARRIGLAAANEVFADRTYRADGSLTPRSEDNALITNTESAVSQVLEMISEGCVTSQTRERIKLESDTVCIHGDGPHALEFAAAVRQGLASMGIGIKAV